ncbi:MAG: hypothetical protein GDA56_30200 [Hormoscilla sp. GM7CHS1pb]|nr:hypothetical protein [Hormoscilla sp. GM7CHS1pb]
MARINGTQRDDLLPGTSEQDEIRGRASNDRLLGDRGNDVLYGNGGRDTLTGGDGSDIFVLSGGRDLITDFTDGQDLIGLPGRVSFDRLRISAGTGANARNTIISLGRIQLAVLEGVSSSQIDAADFTNDLTPISEPPPPPPPPSNGNFNIEFDYRFDSRGFFDDPARRAALEAAADIWEGFIQDEFPNVPAGIKFTVRNPSVSGGETRIVLNSEIDDLLIFVDVHPLPGSTLAEARPDGFDAVGTVFSNRIRGSDFQPWVGSLVFDPDANWFFDSTPNTDGDIPSRQMDFISIALHEIGHILGIGTAGIFRKIGAGRAFYGPNALNVNEGQPIPLERDLFHVQEGFLNDTVSLDPTITNGIRTLPSQVDLALLADIGYEISGFTAQGSTPPIATSGDDLIFGTILADTIDGLGGGDQIQGDRGNDRLNGGSGNDNLFGQAGNDTMNGDAGDDQLAGNGGNDILNGGSNNDNLFGGTGNDILNGDAGNDFLSGEAGDDLLDGGAGDDNLFGDAGRDTFFFGANNGEDRITDFDIATERIQIASGLGFATGADVLATLSRNFINTSVFTLSPGNSIEVFHEDVSNINNTPLTAANFVIV